MSKAKLGFVDPPYRKVIHVEREEGDDSLWRFWGANGGEPIQKTAICGYLTGLGVKDAGEYKGKPIKHLRLNIDCGDEGVFSIKSGLESAFSKSLVCALTELTPDQLAEPVTIVVKASKEEEKIVWPTLFVNGEQVRPQRDYPKSLDQFRAQYKIAQQVVGKIEFNEFGSSN